MPKKKSRAVPKVAYSESDSEYDDEIQTFHKQQDKLLLNNDDQDESADSGEEEVYRLEESDSDDEEIAQMKQQLRQLKRNKMKNKLGSDLEDDTEDEALPDSRAWGSKQSWFMGGDVRDNKIILSGDEDDAGVAALEEKEMREIEKRQLARMTEDDYMPPTVTKITENLKEKEKKKEKKKGDKKKGKKSEGKKSSKCEDSDAKDTEQPEKTKKKKKKEEARSTEISFEEMVKLHPEYHPLVNDFALKTKEFEERILPLMGLVKQGKLDGLVAQYMRAKYHIVSNYLITGGFYVYFMKKKTPRLHHHPVMKRLLEFQQFYNRLVPTDKRLKAELDMILERVGQGQDIGKVECVVPDDSNSTTSKKAARKAKREGGPSAKKQKLEAREALDFEEDEDDDDNETERQLGEDDAAEGDDDDEQGRRAITYQMEKNKGLTVHRKKELKNPRVKHRTKYRRALIRRKGQVREFKQHKTAYTGEMTGIRMGLIRSQSLK